MPRRGATPFPSRGAPGPKVGPAREPPRRPPRPGGRPPPPAPPPRPGPNPAVPFAGIYRIIDFALSNCINSDIRKILVLTQYKAVSLARHIDQGWKFLSRELD